MCRWRPVGAAGADDRQKSQPESKRHNGHENARSDGDGGMDVPKEDEEPRKEEEEGHLKQNREDIHDFRNAPLDEVAQPVLAKSRDLR